MGVGGGIPAGGCCCSAYSTCGTSVSRNSSAGGHTTVKFFTLEKPLIPNERFNESRHVFDTKFFGEGGAEAASTARFSTAPRCSHMLHVSIVDLDLEVIHDGLRLELLVLLDSEDAVLGRIGLGFFRRCQRRQLVGIALILVRREQCCIFGWCIGAFLHWNLERALVHWFVRLCFGVPSFRGIPLTLSVGKAECGIGGLPLYSPAKKADSSSTE